MADKNFKVKTSITSPTPIAITEGGTGQTSANNALNALLPVQTSAANKVLSSDGTSTSWIAQSVAYTRGGVSSRPGSPTAGDLYFNTDKKAFEVWTGSAWVSVAVNGAVPLAPTIGTVTLSSLTASVPFTGPIDFGDAAISTYTATSNPGSISASSASSPISITGLTASTAYTFTVTATNSYGISNASSASNSVTTASVPGAPTSVTISDPGTDGYALVSWTAPSNGGSAITDYIIDYSSNSGSTWTTFSDGTSTATSATVTGLTLSTAYIFRVKAVNVIGTGTVSTSSSSFTPVAHWSPEGGYYSLATITSPAATSITFSGIPAGYKHLQIRGIANNGEASGYNNQSMRFNGDTAANYTVHNVNGNGTAAGVYAQINATQINDIYRIPPAGSIFSTFVIDIFDYASTTKAKTVRSFNGGDSNGSGWIGLHSGLWFKTPEAITSITLGSSVGNFGTNSQFALYGVK